MAMPGAVGVAPPVRPAPSVSATLEGDVPVRPTSWETSVPTAPDGVGVPLPWYSGAEESATATEVSRMGESLTGVMVMTPVSEALLAPAVTVTVTPAARPR